MAEGTILETRGLTKEFKGFIAGRPVNLTVRRTGPYPILLPE